MWIDPKRALKREYKCRTHGSFRNYNTYLRHLKNWCLVWTTASITPLTLVLNFVKVTER